MTALREPLDRSEVRVPQEAPRGAPRVTPVAFPGRWVGGAIGVVATVLVGVALRVVQLLVDDQERLVDSQWLGAASVVSFLGIPIAFVLGRHLAPVANEGGWRSAASAAVTFALLAPPLGDLEIVAGTGLAPWLAGREVNALSAAAGGVIIGGIGLVVSYVALPVTGLVAAVWIVLMRRLPPGVPARLEVPSPAARVGVRHVVYLVAAWLLLAWTAWTILAPAPVETWT